jgi:hypothetical protein
VEKIVRKAAGRRALDGGCGDGHDNSVFVVVEPFSFDHLSLGPRGLVGPVLGDWVVMDSSLSARLRAGIARGWKV